MDDAANPGMSGPVGRFLACLGALFVCGFLELPFFPHPRLPLFYLASLLGCALSLVFRAVVFDRDKARDDRLRSRYAMDRWPLRSKIEQLVAISDLAQPPAAKNPVKIDGLLTAPDSAMMFDPCPSDWPDEKFIVFPEGIIDRLPDSLAEAIASHQLTHLKAQATNSWAKVLGIGILIAAFFGGLSSYQISIPLVALAVWLAFLRLRRRLEVRADRNAVNITRNPEAVIASILLLVQHGFLPPDSASLRDRKLWVPTPSDRVRRIASDYGIPDDRIATLSGSLQ